VRDQPTTVKGCTLQWRHHRYPKAMYSVLWSAAIESVVNPGVADGAAPQQLTNTASTPQLMVGGQMAQVKFAGLAPGFAGLYQVNAVVPSGTVTGPNVSVTLSIDGQTSPPITMPVE